MNNTIQVSDPFGKRKDIDYDKMIIHLVARKTYEAPQKAAEAVDVCA